ncbi:MAG: hypothetical protein LBD64_08660 [Odoribacteraceae bacterium]|jgi:hypothetical protein|nr:hypothetical protein [Odoribacteraceae bacterium]
MSYRTRKNAAWIAWARGLRDACVENATAWQLEETWLQPLSSLVNAATEAYEVNAPKMTKNHATVAAKNEAFTRLKEFLRVFILRLIADTRISDEQLVAMGLRARDRKYKGPLPRPSKEPMLEVFAGKHHVLDAYVSAEQLGRATTRVRENRNYSIVIRYKIEGEEVWREVHSSRLHAYLMFEPGQEGKRVTLTAAWINSRFERGPWSNEVTVIIN